MATYNYGAGHTVNGDAGSAFVDGFKKSRLTKLLGGYYRNGQADVGQIAEIDPQTAQAIQKEQEQRGLAKLFGEAYAAPEDQRGGMLGQLIARGANPDTVMKLDPRYTKGGESFTLSPGSARYGPDGKLIVNQPFAPKGFDGTWDSERGMWIPKPGAMPQEQPAPQGFGSQGGGSQVLDDALVNAVIQQESGGNPNAVSSAGARGLMQVMPGTSRDPGFGIKPMRDNSPEENVRMGRDYLAAMLGRYNGNQTLALAAYNAGPGRVDQALAAAGGDPQRAIAMLPRETQNYVQQVPARMGQNQGGGLRGIPVDGVGPKQPKPEPQSEFDRKIKLARELGATDEQIRNMALGTAGPPQVKPPSIQEVKDASARRLKVPQIANLDRGLKTIEQKLKDLEDNWIGTGPATGWGVGMTEEGQGLETAVGAIQNSLLALTRVPGIGSQSDLEARIANLQYPKTGNYAKNNKILADNLRSLVADIKTAYESLADADNEILASRRGARPQAAKPSQAPNAPANGGFRILD